MIANHYSASLSELDLEMVKSVPPGGNWKNIPTSIPSKRLQQIREGYEAGNGSRSTYYGRLRADEPAYTITTYFSRPGNGCYIHYDYQSGQHRMISQREAARLQGFPDGFEFLGSRSSINKQIGNAVPPILAYQIAKCIGDAGQFIDLFAGAGGLSYGFRMAGWHPVVANDIDDTFLKTYARNVHPKVIPGDIRCPDVRNEVVHTARSARVPGSKFFVLGGPPCQGFSTAGNRRRMSDVRNQLFMDYALVLRELQPDGFVFENVTGLLNMEKGSVFRMIQAHLSASGYNLQIWRISADDYCVPQRRKRVLLVGTLPCQKAVVQPDPITPSEADSLFSPESRGPITCCEALADLPPLTPGEDGSETEYVCEPITAYQAFVRGTISIEDLLATVRRASDHDSSE